MDREHVLHTDDSNLSLSNQIVRIAREQPQPEKILGSVIQRILDHELVDDELRTNLIFAIANEMGIEAQHFFDKDAENAQEAHSYGQEIGIGQQSVTFTEVIKLGEAKLRIRIKSDAYEFESFACIDIWDQAGSKWNSLSTIHFSNMKTPHGLLKDRNPANFEQDRERLIKKAKEILT